MGVSERCWHDDPIVRLEKSLTPLIQDICLAKLCSERQPTDDFVSKIRQQIEKAQSVINAIQSETMLPMNICLTHEETEIVDDLLHKLQRLSQDLPDLMINDASDPIVRRLTKEIAPAVDTALDAFRGRFIGTVLQRQAQHQQAAEAARREIHDISRKIFFISINASVEASRVGDQGKGFAVISKEIRELARRVELSLHELS